MSFDNYFIERLGRTTKECAHAGAWNDWTNEPVLDEPWLTEESAPRAFEDRTRNFDVVPAAVRGGRAEDERRAAPWVLRFFPKSDYPFRVMFSTPRDAISRKIDHHTFAIFRPDATGTLRIDDQASADIRQLSIGDLQVDDYGDDYWMEMPSFGEWQDLLDPDFGECGSESLAPGA